MERYLAHRIIYRGKEHTLAVAEIADDGSIAISPYRGETAATRFVDGTLDLDNFPDNFPGNFPGGKFVNGKFVNLEKNT